MSAFAFMTAPRPLVVDRAKRPLTERWCRKSRYGRVNPGSESYRLMSKAIRLVEKGRTQTQASIEMGRSNSWLSHSAKQLPDTHPLKRRYDKCRKKRLPTPEPEVFEAVVCLMEREGISAAAASKRVEVGNTTFYKAMARLAENDPLLLRYRKVCKFNY